MEIQTWVIDIFYRFLFSYAQTPCETISIENITAVLMMFHNSRYNCKDFVLYGNYLFTTFLPIAEMHLLRASFYILRFFFHARDSFTLLCVFSSDFLLPFSSSFFYHFLFLFFLLFISLCPFLFHILLFVMLHGFHRGLLDKETKPRGKDS